MTRQILSALIVSCLFIGCGSNNDDDFSNSNSNLSEQQPVDDTQSAQETASDKSLDTVCNSLDKADLLFQTSLGSYYVSLETENNDKTLSKTPAVHTIASTEELNAFAQTYKLIDKAKTELLSVDYNSYVIKAVYTGYQPSYNFKFNISSACDNNTLTLEKLSEPAMADMASYWGVFIKLPIQFQSADILVEDKELTLEEYNTYPDIPILY